jgi:DNA-binding NtrC family response regulator
MSTAATQAVLRATRVLIASSNEAFRRLCIESREYESAEVEEALGGADALSKLETEEWSEVLLDSRLHDLDAREVVNIIHRRHPQLMVRLVDSEPAATSSPVPAAMAAQRATAQNIPLQRTMEEAFAASDVEPMSSEAANDELRIEPAEPAEPLDEALPTLSRIVPLPGMMGIGPGLAQIYRLARLVAPRNTTVLITGETGTGKELVARGIHQASRRAKNPFVVVNCAAIPEPLLEAELFGHARGAFTGAVQSRLGRIHVAHGGTLFLDEVGELPLSIQAKLLRFLQDGEVQRLGSSDVFRVDVRVVSATNVNLLRCVQEKQFRQDLYYRLAVFSMELPPLRQRKEDILSLAEHFLAQLCAEAGGPTKTFSASAAAVLRQYQWPGNVRELQHAVERGFILSEDERQLRAMHFSLPETSTTLREI